MEADVQGVSQTTTVAVGSTPQQFAEQQQKLREKATENQAEDEVGRSKRATRSRNKVQMVKKYHMRNSSIKQTLSRSDHAKQQELQQTTHQIQVAEEQIVHDNGVKMRATKQDGDEDSLESTEVSVQKATESRNKVQKVSEDTFPEAPAEESSKKSQTTRSTESEAQKATNEQSKIAEVTKIETLYDQSLGRQRRRSHSKKFSREVLQKTSRDNQ